MDALYRSSHPEYVQYIYLVAPVSLMLLNPVGFALCEIQRWKHSNDRSYSKLHVIFTVILQVCACIYLNPEVSVDVSLFSCWSHLFSLFRF